MAQPPPATPTPRRASYGEGFALSILSFAALALLGIVTGIVTARLYGIGSIGEFAIAYAPTGAVWFLSSVREQPAMVRLLAALPVRDPRGTGIFLAVLGFSSALTLAACLVATVAALVVIAGPVGQPDLVAPAVVLLATYLLVKNPAWNMDSYFAAYRAARPLFWVRLHEAAVNLILAVGLSFVTTSVWGLVAATAGSMLSSLLHRLVLLPRWLTPRVERVQVREGVRRLPEIIRFGLKLTPGALADGVSQETATWTIAVAGTVPEIGAYSRAWSLATRFLQVNYRITEMLFPTLVERRHLGDGPGFDRALVDTLRYVAFGLGLVGAAGGGAAPGIMRLYGAAFERGSGALTLLLFVPALTSMSAVQNQALFADGRPWITSAISLGRVVVTVGAVIGLTLAFGITGAAAGVLAACVADFLARTIVVHRLLASPLRRLWRPTGALAVVVALAAGFAAARFVADAVPNVAGALLALLAGSLVALAALVSLGGLEPRDRERLGRVRGRMRALRGRPAPTA